MTARSTLYVDESGMHGGEVMLMVGVLAKNEEWDELEVEWQQILEQEPAARSFHMSDAFGGRNAHACWTRDVRNRRFEQLSNVLVGRVLCTCTVYMATYDYEKYVRGRVDDRQDDPYFVAFTCMLSGLFKIPQLDRRAHAPVDVVLDRHEEHGHKALREISRLRDILDSEDAGLLGEVRMRGKHERLIPLEAADMVAWCQHRKLTRADGATLPVYRVLLDKIPRNHFRAGPRYLDLYMSSGWDPTSARTS